MICQTKQDLDAWRRSIDTKCSNMHCNSTQILWQQKSIDSYCWWRRSWQWKSCVQIENQAHQAHQSCRIIIQRSSCISLDIYLCCCIHLPQSFPSKQALNPVAFPAICLHWFYPDQPSLATTVEGGLRAICSWKRRAWRRRTHCGLTRHLGVKVRIEDGETETDRARGRERGSCIHACAKETEEETRRLLLQELGEKVGKDAQQSVGKSSFAHGWSSSF